ncbi:hypothetical protein HNR43_002648 [Anoxybacillus mongoliensis]|uniref:Uncharacterized protein n=1 Tax=Anoxybacillus mongoliensis TaxID=452565 RepID=A0A7W8JJA0_9BACL|nr:hypothetical protein [Anoxybacillus mongoliensis]MBB5356636.1 hypothetical protein [Anoxybacillus mongoliensis]
MRISDFLKRYNLHGSLINNVEYDSITKRVFLETELCKWQKSDYDESKDPEMIDGFIVFEDVTCFETDCVKDFDADEILEVVLISKNQSSERAKIVTDGVNIIIIEAGNVDWYPL